MTEDEAIDSLMHISPEKMREMILQRAGVSFEGKPYSHVVSWWVINFFWDEVSQEWRKYSSLDAAADENEYYNRFV